MDQGIKWFKEQLENRKFQHSFIFILGVGIGLMAEFFVFSYSILKILRYLILYLALFLIAWIDQQHRRIPNKILLRLLVLRGGIFVLEWLMFPNMILAILISAILGLLLGGGLLLLAHFISKGGVGMGDVKLLAVTGGYMGSGSVMTVVFLSVIISAVYSIVMLMLKKIKLKEEIPFAPFIWIGTMLTMALGM